MKNLIYTYNRLGDADIASGSRRGCPDAHPQGCRHRAGELATRRRGAGRRKYLADGPYGVALAHDRDATLVAGGDDDFDTLSIALDVERFRNDGM